MLCQWKGLQVLLNKQELKNDGKVMKCLRSRYQCDQQMDV